ncbi:hypothetical protein NQ314_002474 [Rhamnusium bicolor]|uniref:Transposable element P transposase-like RNase H domain-containing protein n=1 Tax=Rhamnusium bicolor TaxID=1586634 RepID=A0AAV8ZPY3_9CUCU|nr:hypothetical protein NQ314_002474 [Rhamnusium bicolor]
MHLSTSVAFNRQKLQVQGFTNLGKYTPKHQVNKRADHALVLMFQPFQGKWVQTLACFLSKGCASFTVLHQIVIEAIKLTEQAGFYIDAIVSDGASWNRSMWNKFGITADHVSCTHIVDPLRKLWFISDFPHLIKCLRNFIIKWAETWVCTFQHKSVLALAILFFFLQTPDGVIKLQHWQSLIETENSLGYNLKLGYKLTPDHIQPRYYQKMNVALAFQVRFFFFNNYPTNVSIVVFWSRTCNGNIGPLR